MIPLSQEGALRMLKVAGSVIKVVKQVIACYPPPVEITWRRTVIMDYELRIVVEKVAVRSQEVVKRDTIKRYGIQRPASIVDLGLRHVEQISLLETIQHALLVVCCTSGMDTLCRQVQRLLLRNELARFYHHRTRKCLPPRKLRREIQ